MKTVYNIEEATNHFENSFDPVLCERAEGEETEVSEKKNLEEAREFYLFTPPAEPVQEQAELGSINEEITGNGLGNTLPPAEQTGADAQDANDDPVL